MKKPENPDVEEALYTWFLQQRKNHIPVSSEVLRTKARFFYERITGKTNFQASSGWLDKFKARRGIRFLKVCGERVSSDAEAVAPFQLKLQALIEKMQLTKEQVYNANESALFWRVLPNTTWVHKDEKSAPGRKVSKDRVTFMPCSNASGTHKLPLLVLGKSKNPRVFKNAQLPVKYEASTKGWMTRNIFSEWFKTIFVPEVKQYLSNANKPCRALLLVDNAPSHPPEEELNTNPNFIVVFLPPNCTALVQPMDQNLIQNIKVSYRRQLLTHIISQENKDTMQLLKKFSLLDAVNTLDSAWKSITEKNIQKSWDGIWPQLVSDEEDDILLADLRKSLLEEAAKLNDLKKMLKVIDPESELNDEEIRNWATGRDEIAVDNVGDEEIIESVQSNTNDEEEEDVIDIPTKIKHIEAVQCFSKCVQWAEENKLNYQEVLLLKKNLELSRKLHNENLIQKKIGDFLPLNTRT